MVIFDCGNSNSGWGRLRHCDDCGGGDCYGRDRGGGGGGDGEDGGGDGCDGGGGAS